MEHRTPRLFQCGEQCEVAVEVFAGHTTVTVQHRLQAAMQTVDGVQMVGFVVILVGVQHNLLALLCFDQLVISRGSVAQEHAVLADSCAEGFLDVLGGGLGPVDAARNNATLPVSGNANAHLLVGKAAFRCGLVNFCAGVGSKRFGCYEKIFEKSFVSHPAKAQFFVLGI